tara:strand:+ start:661 stop:894 length:234 start_codon:yes stop_codon:yes gene_type:complete
MNLTNKKELKKMSKKAKLQALKDMKRESNLKNKNKSNRNLSLISDAMDEAELYRLIFGADFVDNDETIKQTIKERLN